MSEKTRPKNWSAEFDVIERLCAVPTMNAARLFRIMESDLPQAHTSGPKNQINQDAANALGWARYANGAPAFRISPIDNRYSIIPSHLNNERIVPTVANMAGAETTAIVELGTGYGRHLFALRDLLEHRFPALRYFGCEISESGLEAGRAITALEPNRMPVVFHAFNYLEPDLSFLAGYRDIIFFTCHSIEQVKGIGENLFHTIMDAAERVRCVHAEPVGWQFNEELMAELAANGKLAEDRVYDFALWKPLDDYHAATMPTRLGWNHNLIQTLRSLSAKGAVSLGTVEKNCCGNDIYNPTTIIHWTKPGSDAAL